MPFNIENLSLLEWVIVASVFGLVLSLWYFAAGVWIRFRAARAEKLRKRLDADGSTTGRTTVLRLWHDGKEMTLPLQHRQKRASWSERLERTRRMAGLEMPLMQYGGMVLMAAGAIAATAYYWVQDFVAPITAAVCVVLLARAYVVHRIQRRTSLFEVQLLDALQLAARSLRAGHPLTGAFQLIGKEIGDPVGTVFNDICQQQELGLSQEEAIMAAAEKSTSEDLKLFATSVGIQLRSGGNLADMMDQLASVIRDRMRINRRIRVLTAQTQLSKKILVSLPFFMFLVISVLDETYLEPLYTTPEGRFLIGTAAVCLLLGTYSMNRLTRLSY